MRLRRTLSGYLGTKIQYLSSYRDNGIVVAKGMGLTDITICEIAIQPDMTFLPLFLHCDTCGPSPTPSFSGYLCTLDNLINCFDAFMT